MSCVAQVARNIVLVPNAAPPTAGRNLEGELGDGTTVNKNVPTPVATTLVTNWKQLSTGGFHNCGLAAALAADV